jgi:hypothetical protein
MPRIPSHKATLPGEPVLHYHEALEVFKDHEVLLRQAKLSHAERWERWSRTVSDEAVMFCVMRDSGCLEEVDFDVYRILHGKIAHG